MLPSGKVLAGTAEGTVTTGRDVVIPEGWLILMEQEEIVMTKMSTQTMTDRIFNLIPS